jgi:Tfp pilus assembly protein PilF
MRKILKGTIALVALLLMVSGATPVFAQTAERNTAARYINSGMEQIKAKEYQAARESFEQALR